MLQTNTKITDKVRLTVQKRDDYSCVLCGKVNTHLHHAVKRSQGGKNLPENLVCLCWKCHETIHDKLEDWQEKEQQITEYLADYYTNDKIIWVCGKLRRG